MSPPQGTTFIHKCCKGNLGHKTALVENPKSEQPCTQNNNPNSHRAPLCPRHNPVHCTPILTCNGLPSNTLYSRPLSSFTDEKTGVQNARHLRGRGKSKWGAEGHLPWVCAPNFCPTPAKMQENKHNQNHFSFKIFSSLLVLAP